MYDGEGLLQRPKQPEINEHIREETAEIQPQENINKTRTHESPRLVKEGEHKGHYVAFDPEIGAVAFGTSNELMIQRELEFISRFPDECKQFYQEPEKKKIEPKTISAKPQTKSAEIQARTETPQTTLEIAISTQPVLQEETAELQTSLICPTRMCQITEFRNNGEFCGKCGERGVPYSEQILATKREYQKGLDRRGKTTQREAPSRLEIQATTTDEGIVWDSAKESAGVVGDIAVAIGQGLNTVGKGILKGTYSALDVSGAVLAIPTTFLEMNKEYNEILKKSGESRAIEQTSERAKTLFWGNFLTVIGLVESLPYESFPTKETLLAIAGANFVSGVGEIIRAGIRRAKTKRADLEAKLVEQYGTPEEFAERTIEKFKTYEIYKELAKKMGIESEEFTRIHGKIINSLGDTELVFPSTNNSAYLDNRKAHRHPPIKTIRTYSKRLARVIEFPTLDHAIATVTKMTETNEWSRKFTRKVHSCQSEPHRYAYRYKFKKQGRNRKGEQLYELCPEKL